MPMVLSQANAQVRKSVFAMKIDYDISDLQPYINWDYFYYAWGMHNKPEAEKQRLREEAELTLSRLNGSYRTHALFRLFSAYSDGDDVVVYDKRENQDEKTERIPFLRQQQPGSHYLCLADFIQPHDVVLNADKGSRLSPSITSMLGIFATSVDHGMETDFDHDPYEKMMVQLLADRLAEAAAERMHEAVRKQYWGYAPGEQLTMQQLHAEQFQGIRPAVGYPLLPDTSLNFVIDELIGLRQIGVRLTESAAMKPHASVSGFMMAHPKARYFSLGKIGNDQLVDYARRRNLPVEVMRKFLSSNL